MLHRVLSHEEATVSTVGAAENYMTPSLGLGIDIVSLLEVEQEGGQKIQNGCTNITRFFLVGGLKTTIKAPSTNGSTCLVAREVAHLLV